MASMVLATIGFLDSLLASQLTIFGFALVLYAFRYASDLVSPFATSSAKRACFAVSVALGTLSMLCMVCPLSASLMALRDGLVIVSIVR